MEFVQFHPTGMIWPPSVMGILVTEGVRGGRRHPDEQGWEAFHVRFDSRTTIKAQTADNEEEGWRYCQGDKNVTPPAGVTDARSPLPAALCARSKRAGVIAARRCLSRYRLDQTKNRELG